jgi:hypothetical protein
MSLYTNRVAGTVSVGSGWALLDRSSALYFYKYKGSNTKNKLIIIS